jgi:N-acetylmuramic acid 6-phosphate etherase
MVDLQVNSRKLRDRGERILVETLGVQRPEATDLLERAGGHVKTALVMGALGLGRDEARARLDETGGILGDLIDVPEDGS